MLLRGGVPNGGRYEKGFALPAGAFFRGLLFFYGLEVLHLKPNSIA